ncbi:MAG: TcpQ domain-containing protein [Gammaproteobacteria bacterium]
MIYRYLLTCVILFLVGCTNTPSVDYTGEYARTSDANRAVQSTQEAMKTDDVVDTLSQMLGSPNQTETVIASNVQIVHKLDELNNPAYKYYTLRVADNITVSRTYDMKDGYSSSSKGHKIYSKDSPYKGDHYSKDSLSSLRVKLEDIKHQYPHSVIALNKQDKIISVAKDSLEAQALAQKSPRVFYVLQGQTLKQTIGRWSKQSKWGMQWAVQKDYTMVAPATIFGEFSAQGGSLDQLLGTLRYLDQPLKAQFTRNKMVVIRDGSYSSSIMAISP